MEKGTFFLTAVCLHCRYMFCPRETDSLLFCDLSALFHSACASFLPLSLCSLLPPFLRVSVCPPVGPSPSPPCGWVLLAAQRGLATSAGIGARRLYARARARGFGCHPRDAQTPLAPIPCAAEYGSADPHTA